MSYTGQTGPKTEEGKKRSSLNAIKHGLTARSAHGVEAMAEEAGVQYEPILDQVRSTYRPTDFVEDELVKQVACCLWRLGSLRRMEQRLVQRTGERFSPGASREAILRAERTVSTELHRCIRTLTIKHGGTATCRPGTDSSRPTTESPENETPSRSV